MDLQLKGFRSSGSSFISCIVTSTKILTSEKEMLCCIITITPQKYWRHTDCSLGDTDALWACHAILPLMESNMWRDQHLCFTSTFTSTFTFQVSPLLFHFYIICFVISFKLFWSVENKNTILLAYSQSTSSYSHKQLRSLWVVFDMFEVAVHQGRFSIRTR